MRLFQRLARAIAMTIAFLFMAVSAVGTFGAWYGARAAAQAVSTAFRVVGKGVGALDEGARRAEELVDKCQNELREASTVAGSFEERPETAGPALSALAERLERRIVEMEEALAPARDALRETRATVAWLRSLPVLSGRLPETPRLEAALERLQDLRAEVEQARGRLRKIVAVKADERRAEALVRLTLAFERVETGSSAVLRQVHEAQTGLRKLQGSLDAREARMRLAITLTALAVTLLLAWNGYAQLVVIRHHCSRRGAAVPPRAY